ncbi:MAG: VCBS repeat-containing protein [Candidatus Kapabacteria bacterium]|nr:VCBS repeat-containing protein [Candidatus Kapabacteria bacterium]
MVTANSCHSAIFVEEFTDGLYSPTFLCEATMTPCFPVLRFVVFSALALCISTVSASAQDATWFRDVTSAVKLDSARSGQISSCDINGDGYPDVLFQVLAYNRSMKTRLYLNKQHPDSSNPKARIFVDVTDQSNIYENRNPGVTGRVADTWGIADVNNDGFPDLVSGLFYFNVSTFVDPGDRTEVLLNDGTGKFTLVKNSGLPDLDKFPATSFCFLDYDLDGKLDIYIGTFSANHQQDVWLPGLLMRGRGDGTFEDVTEPSGLINVLEPTYGASVTDWNNDGYPDIMTSPYCRTEGTLWKNNGNGTFTNVTKETGYSSKNGMWGNVDAGGSVNNLLLFPRELCQWEALPCDYDNDGDMDIAQMLIHGGLDTMEGRSTLTMNGGAANGYKLTWNTNAFDRPLNTNQVVLRKTVANDTTWSNQYGTFSAKKGTVITAATNGHLGDQAGSWFDMDNDMRQDFLLSSTGYDGANDRCYIQHQQPNGTFKEIAQQLGVRSILKETHSNRPFDYDLDGDDDFLVQYSPRTANPQSGRVWLMQNNIGNKNNYVSIKLRTPNGCNKNGIGCRVWVYAGGVSQMRDIQSGVGRWGMTSPFTLNFGLGKNTVIDSIVVRWAMKSLPKTTIVNPPVNAMLTISREGLDPVSVNEETLPAEPLTVSPNPAASRVVVNVPAAYRSNAHCELYSLHGERLLRQRCEGEERLGITLDAFAPGVYIIRFSNATHSQTTSFIKGE